MNIWAIIPVKPLRHSKSRLAHIMSPEERAELTASILSRTLIVLQQVESILQVMVVSRDPVALKIARRHGASTYGETERQDLNMALTRAAHITAARRGECLLILPSDLPLVAPEDVEMMINGRAYTWDRALGEHSYHGRSMAICCDHNGEGTNALLICPPTGYVFQFGPNSFQRHLAEADRLGMSKRIIHAPGLKFDLDTETDWNAYLALRPDKAIITPAL
jgi:2-phospho-L-lactate guanylyltransferase